MDGLILGMDLSLACPAFAIGRIVDEKIDIIHISHVKTNDKKSFSYRLFEIYNHVKELLETYDIKYVVKEKGFSMHVTTTAKLRGVDGVVALCVYQYLGLEDYPEIAPTTVKKDVTGDGKADKKLVLENIGKHLLNPVTLSGTKAKFDEADAIGVIISAAKGKKLLK